MQMRPLEADEAQSNQLRVDLDEAYAECMGEGMFLLFHGEAGDDRGVLLTLSDLQKLLARNGL